MSFRSVVMEGTPLANAGEIRYFETDAPTAGHLMRSGSIRAVATHYDREWSDATVYEVVDGSRFEFLSTIAGRGDGPIRVYSLAGP